MKKLIIATLIALFTITSALALKLTIDRSSWDEAQQDPIFYNELGFHLANEGAMLEAQGAFAKAVALDPGYENARKNLYVTAFQNGEYALSAEHAGILRKQHPGNDQYAFDYAQALVMHARTDETDAGKAVADLEEAAAIFEELGNFAHAAENAAIVRAVLENALN